MIRDGSRWLAFAEPAEVVTASSADEVLACLQRVEPAVESDALWAVGFLAYEAAGAFGLASLRDGERKLPLLWLGLYERPVEVDLFAAGDSYRLGSWSEAVGQSEYSASISRIKELIAAGDTYQVNYTFPMQAAFEGDPWTLFRDLERAQRTGYAAYLDLGTHAICSVSPELFFRLDGDRLVSKPMKGTAHRGRTLSEDRERVDWLHKSEKNRAENLMVVDMIRNDMGRVCDVGTVKVPSLFEVEHYPTVLQMISTVSGRTDAGLSGIMAAMFPCASITGAPKMRTMEIIAELEGRPRGVYTGAIGYWAPGRTAQFNVGIRTVVVDRERGIAGYGVGSGVVWESDPEAEYDECRTKARVLMDRDRGEFQLLETMLWSPEEGFFLLERHLSRLAESAEYFAFPYCEETAKNELRDLASKLTCPSIVRLLMDAEGWITLRANPLGEGTGQSRSVPVGLASEPVRSADPRLFHKTSRRELYDSARSSCPDCEEAILWNEREEATEGDRSNLVIRLDGEFVTPPISCGLLPGTYRAQLLADGTIREAVIPLAVLRACDEIYLINSVRKWRRVTLVDGNGAGL